MKEVLSDVRLAVRQWSNRPAWIAVILLTLATGIGTTTSVFSIVEAVVLRSLRRLHRCCPAIAPCPRSRGRSFATNESILNPVKNKNATILR